MIIKTAEPIKMPNARSTYRSLFKGNHKLGIAHKLWTTPTLIISLEAIFWASSQVVWSCMERRVRYPMKSLIFLGGNRNKTRPSIINRGPVKRSVIIYEEADNSSSRYESGRIIQITLATTDNSGLIIRLICASPPGDSSYDSPLFHYSVREKLFPIPWCGCVPY